MTSIAYSGPAGVIFTSEELLEIWAVLCRNPTAENKPLRDKVKAWLESSPSYSQ